MESITLNVKPQVLVAKAGELSAEKSTVNGLMEEAKAKMAALTGTWRSAASDEYQTRFRQVHSDIEGMLAVMSEYIHNLTEAANLYTAGEQAATSTTQGLPTSGIFN
jgi:WXG100 family type VII secretion target